MDRAHVATLMPMAPMPLITDLSPLDQTMVLAPFAKLHRFNAVVILEAPLASARLEILHSSLLKQISEWMLQSKIHIKDSLLCRLLLETGLADLSDSSDSISHISSELDGWEPHDLFFQYRSRYGFHTYPSGALFLAAGRRDPPPANRIRDKSEQRVSLCAPQSIHSSTLESVISKRVSASDFMDIQPSLDQMSELLWRTMRQTGELSMPVKDDSGLMHDFQLKRRPVPSGGSVHEIDAYLLVNSPGPLSQGLWRYDDKYHELVMAACPSVHTQLILTHGQISAGLEKHPPLMLIFSARFDRMMWKYSSLSLAAILKHVGVLYEIFYLVATDMGLGIRGLGSGESRAFSEAINVHPALESSVGEMLLGLSESLTA